MSLLLSLRVTFHSCLAFLPTPLLEPSSTWTVVPLAARHIIEARELFNSFFKDDSGVENLEGR